MPIIEQNPGWSSALAFLLTGAGALQGQRNQKKDRDRQAQIDAQNTALTQAQLGQYKSEAEMQPLRKKQIETQIGAEGALTTQRRRESGLDASGNPLVLPNELRAPLGKNKGNRAIELRNFIDRNTQIANYYAQQGDYRAAGEYMAAAKSYQTELEKMLGAQSSERIADKRLSAQSKRDDKLFRERVVLKGIPSYSNLHHVGRSGRAGAAGVDDDTAMQAEAQIQKSSDPVATAENLASQVTLHGGKSASKTAEYIKLRGAYWAHKHKPANPLLQP